MELLATITSDEIDEVRRRFREGGIPIYLEPDHSRGLRFLTGTAGSVNSAGHDVAAYRLHVCILSQLEEAEQLLIDPGYKVRYPVDVEEFEAAIEAARKDEVPEAGSSRGSQNRIAAGVVLVCAVALILLAAVIVR